MHDVNAVGYLDETSNIIFTGQDDGIIQVSEVAVFSGLY